MATFIPAVNLGIKNALDTCAAACAATNIPFYIYCMTHPMTDAGTIDGNKIIAGDIDEGGSITFVEITESTPDGIRASMKHPNNAIAAAYAKLAAGAAGASALGAGALRRSNVDVFGPDAYGGFYDPDDPDAVGEAFASYDPMSLPQPSSARSRVPFGGAMVQPTSVDPMSLQQSSTRSRVPFGGAVAQPTSANTPPPQLSRTATTTTTAGVRQPPAPAAPAAHATPEAFIAALTAKFTTAANYNITSISDTNKILAMLTPTAVKLKHNAATAKTATLTLSKAAKAAGKSGVFAVIADGAAVIDSHVADTAAYTAIIAHNTPEILASWNNSTPAEKEAASTATPSINPFTVYSGGSSHSMKRRRRHRKKHNTKRRARK
jgi:hypothetical protein